MLLAPCDPESAYVVAGWLLNADEARFWGGEKTPFPVTKELVLNWHSDSSVQPFVAFENESLVAYGELWVDRAEDEIELARIIVESEKRNTGIGQAFVKLLVKRAHDLGIDNLYLRVLPKNIVAIRCYESAGFRPVSSEYQALYNRGQPVEYLWMKSPN